MKTLQPTHSVDAVEPRSAVLVLVGQLAQLDAPHSDWYEFLSQGRHAVELLSGKYAPGGQPRAEQLDEPSTEALPAEQAVQVVAVEAADNDEYIPAAHWVHEVDPEDSE